jgi:hypothetical protein
MCTSCSTRRYAKSDMDVARWSSCSICCWIWEFRGQKGKYQRPGLALTDCAKTRCRNTCMTTGGFGNTALTICASVSTVARISTKSSVNPVSLLGALASGSGRVFHLQTVPIETQNAKRIIYNKTSSAGFLSRTWLMKKSCWLT